jgi:lysophospholipase
MPFQTVTKQMMIDQSTNRRQIPDDATIDFLPATDGWPLRRFSRPAMAGAPHRGTILFLGGRGDFFEKGIESLNDWHRRGWGIVSVDWRGQGGSGRLSDDPRVGHAEDFAVWIDDLAHVWARFIAETPGPHVVVSHSMGGHLTLRALVERRIDPSAAVFSAPMLGFNAPYPDWLGQKVAGLMCRLRGKQTAAWKESEKPGASMKMRQLLLTHDPDRYQDELWWHAQNPALRLGPASWGWVRTAYDSFLALARPGKLESVTTPLLILSVSRDALVSAAATRRDAARLPTAVFHEYGAGVAHEVLRETDETRNDVLSRIDSFLSEKVTRP